MWLWILLLSNAKFSLQCSWPTVDALFVIDSTATIGANNYVLIKNFLSKVVDNMNIAQWQTHVAIASYTPMPKYEFNLNSGTNKNVVLNRIQNLRYVPCLSLGIDDCKPAASINSIASHELTISAGDRQQVPDVIIILSSTVRRIPELLSREVLIAPVSPIHAFSITVGALDDFSPSSATLTSSATTIKFSAYNYTMLDRLVEPLCTAANAFIQSNSDRNHHAAVFFGTTAGLVTVICFIIMTLIALALLACALVRYRKENEQLRHQMETSENDYQKAVAVNKRLQQIVSQYAAAEKSRSELQNTDLNSTNKNIKNDKHNNDKTISDNQAETGNSDQCSSRQGSAKKRKHLEYTDSELEAYATVKKYDRRKNAIVPLIDAETITENDQKPKDKENQQPAKESDASTEVCDECRNDEKTDHNQDNQNHDETNQNNANETTNENNNNEYNEEIGDDEGEISEPDSTTAPNYGHLSPNHPALLLPPVDIMLLMDSSSSIGINGFRQMRIQVNKFLSDVNIAPGRSRVAVVIFANEPTVYFGFDKYYSYHSVARRIGTIPYIGGPTFLAKALTFAAGVLYQEQNMKDGKHRKHKFMPTPHHDRLQVLIVISDGYSEDNYEKISHILHEKLHVKTAALVMRTYNKERLLPITRYEGAIFLIHQTEALNMWLWRQQRLWNENYADYVQKEKAFMMEQKKKKKL